MGWDGESYQARFDRLAAAGEHVHGEADFVAGLEPASVLDAGCGTGRVAIELARRGVDVVGIDLDESMIQTARRLAPELEWIVGDISAARLGRRFDVVLMAGNVPLFTPPGTRAGLVDGCARHLAPGGALVAGFQIRRGFRLSTYDGYCTAVGLHLAERHATWDRQPFDDGADYAVSVHR